VTIFSVAVVQTIALLIRLFAIWLLVFDADIVIQGLTRMTRVQDSYFGFVALSIFIFSFLIYMYRFPVSIAQLLLRNISEPNSPGPGVTSSEEWFRVGQCLLGLWFIGSSFPQLIATLLLRGNYQASEANALWYLLSAGITSLLGAMLLAGWPKARLLVSISRRDAPR
jgi:hypothetical protein